MCSNLTVGRDLYCDPATDYSYQSRPFDSPCSLLFEESQSKRLGRGLIIVSLVFISFKVRSDSFDNPFCPYFIRISHHNTLSSDGSKVTPAQRFERIIRKLFSKYQNVLINDNFPHENISKELSFLIKNLEKISVRNSVIYKGGQQ